jgi:putative ABC transport system permease protein
MPAGGYGRSVRVLWVKAPWVLVRHPAVLLSVMAASFLVALAATSAPVVRAGVESESLKGQLVAMSPLAAGLQIQTSVAAGGVVPAAVSGLPVSLPSLAAPVVTDESGAIVAGADGSGLGLVPMLRTNALGHVQRLTRGRGGGVWISSATAKATQLRPGGVLRLTQAALPGVRPRVVSLRVAGIYRSLDQDLGNPYWQNFIQDIRAPNPDATLPPSFVLMPRRAFLQFARALSPSVVRRYEFAVDPTRLSLAGAKTLQRRFAAIQAALADRGSGLSRSFGCRPRCTSSSSLGSALTIAQNDVASVGPTISLLAGCAILIALTAAGGAGVFLVRRRSGESRFLFMRGEAALVFGTRVAVEASLPTLVGAAVGVAAALLALGEFAPTGTIDGGTVSSAIWHAAFAAAATVAAVAAGAGVAFPRRAGTRRGRRIARWLPWELLPLAAAAALLVDVLTGGGLVHDTGGGTHPRLAVFFVPVLAAAGLAGLVARAARMAIGARGGGAPPVVFLALRRLAAAGGLLVAAIVMAAASFGTFAYASTLSASLRAGVAEKAFIATGGDVQGVVDPSVRILRPFPFPAAIVEIDSDDVRLGANGGAVTVIAGDPRGVARSLAKDDARQQLLALAAASSNRALPIIAVGKLPNLSAVWDQGRRLPVTIVGRVRAFPGSTAGTPSVVVARSALGRAARRAGLAGPLPGATGAIWAKGDPITITRALAASKLYPVYLTTIGDLLAMPAVTAATRTYGFFDWIGIAAAALALAAVLLYLHARQREQLIASALARRMGLSRAGDAAALALEAAAITATAVCVGVLAAELTARALVNHVDPLAQWSPSLTLVVPWSWLIITLVAATTTAALLGAAAGLVAGRGDVAQELRVA